jgi:hypothetical protein
MARWLAAKCDRAGRDMAEYVRGTVHRITCRTASLVGGGLLKLKAGATPRAVNVDLNVMASYPGA